MKVAATFNLFNEIKNLTILRCPLSHAKCNIV